jgi:hypothetical protein
LSMARSSTLASDVERMSWSNKVVFPWSTWAMIATFRVDDDVVDARRLHDRA